MSTNPGEKPPIAAVVTKATKEDADDFARQSRAVGFQVRVHKRSLWVEGVSVDVWALVLRGALRTPAPGDAR